mmetsp:Transcript_78991/g.189686  ORF Transcript_78991/g.189686 Transcript_78991/m.189686 type:complete len:245 (-) Transcript_78991:382-1116(-)
MGGRKWTRSKSAKIAATPTMTASASTTPRPMRRMTPRCARSTIKTNRLTSGRMNRSSAPGRSAMNSRKAAHTANSGGGWAVELADWGIQIVESPIWMPAQWRWLRIKSAMGSTLTMVGLSWAAAIANARSISVRRQGRPFRLLPPLTVCTGCSNPWDSMAKGFAMRGRFISRRLGSLPAALSARKASTPTSLPRGRREPGRCAERKIRRPSSSAFGRMRATDATPHPRALHLATPMYRPGSLCS